ncbi:MAG: hypothetical protein ACTSYI_03095 [Promethearchaeota archaeon]
MDSQQITVNEWIKNYLISLLLSGIGCIFIILLGKYYDQLANGQILLRYILFSVAFSIVLLLVNFRRFKHNYIMKNEILLHGNEKQIDPASIKKAKTNVIRAIFIKFFISGGVYILLMKAFSDETDIIYYSGLWGLFGSIITIIEFQELRYKYLLTLIEYEFPEEKDKHTYESTWVETLILIISVLAIFTVSYFI